MSKYEKLRLSLREPHVLLPIYIVALYIPILLNISVFVNNVFTQILIQEPNMTGVRAIINMLRNLDTYYLSTEFVAPLIISYSLLGVFIIIRFAGKKKALD
jgi:hypothetical protein